MRHDAPPAHLDEVVVVEADLHLVVDVAGGDVAVADVVYHDVGHASHVGLDGPALSPQLQAGKAEGSGERDARPAAGHASDHDDAAGDGARPRHNSMEQATGQPEVTVSGSLTGRPASL